MAEGIANNVPSLPSVYELRLELYGRGEIAYNSNVNAQSAMDKLILLIAA
jgi:hypothetical protein